MISVWCLLFSVAVVSAQNKYELNTGWKCAPISKITSSGTDISLPGFSLDTWMNATVPGTVLTNMLNNKLVADPFYGMNNEHIPDIYTTGRDYYTYWFVKDFKDKVPVGDEQVWLNFRGINYSCDVFLNGKKLNTSRHYGMFLRQRYNITSTLNKNGGNRLAVIVYPLEEVGNPNGGQGGDGTIAKNVAHQYVAGWDWIQPIRDRNTGIWDKVEIEKTKSISIKNPHIITLVPGKRNLSDNQAPAIIKVSTELANASNKTVTGTLQYQIAGQTIKQTVVLPANGIANIQLPDLIVPNPKLWWPNGYGPQNLYPSTLQFITNNIISDEEKITVGIRQINSDWNIITQSKQIEINGQKIFIKGGNWIISDAMLRLSNERYDAEVRFHRDMNLNLIRIWGGALLERPEFYAACDKYGMLVMQDFGFSGDCNGRWVDPQKKEDQWTRRKYPDDHNLFLNSAADGVKMIRNHASLAIWCGGNEITPPEDILVPLRDSIIGKLDGTRVFIEYSNSDSMSYNFLGGNGDGPYGIQDVKTFWEHRTFPFNSEVGSVGVGDYESLERFIPAANLIPPKFPSKTMDSVWDYHKYIGYDDAIDPYGAVKDAKDFALKAQLVNYNQYRSLAEGFSAHIWDWYTGFIIWKTQNPWTAMRGQMYDYYLDVNACLYGLRSGSEALHVMCNPADGTVMLVNNGIEERRNIMVVIKTYDTDGKEKLVTQAFTFIGPSAVKKIMPVKDIMDKLANEKGTFLDLQLLDENKNLLSDNFYWYPDGSGHYSGLQTMAKATVNMAAKNLGDGKVEVTISNPANNAVAFFNRLSVVNAQTHQRVLPSFFTDNYFSIAPGGEKKIVVDYPAVQKKQSLQVVLKGWNVDEKLISIQ